MVTQLGQAHLEDSPFWLIQNHMIWNLVISAESLFLYCHQLMEI